MSGAASNFWVRPAPEGEQADDLTPFDAATLWTDWFCLFCSGDVSETAEWGRFAVPYIDRMMRRLEAVEHGGTWRSEGL